MHAINLHNHIQFPHKQLKKFKSNWNFVQVFGKAMFGSESDLFETWTDLPHHPLQIQEPNGDRHWIGKPVRVNIHLYINVHIP